MYEAVNEVENDIIKVKVMKELNKYRELPRISPSEDPLKFWKKHSDDLPLLADFASKYLVVQGSSVAGERVFSTAGDIVTAERSCLDPEHVNMLLFLQKRNCRIFICRKVFV